MMLWFGFQSTCLFVFCLVSLFCLCKADLCYLLLFKLQTFLSLTEQSLSRSRLSPGLPIDPLPLCKKNPTDMSVAFCRDDTLKMVEYFMFISRTWPFLFDCNNARENLPACIKKRKQSYFLVFLGKLCAGLPQGRFSGQSSSLAQVLVLSQPYVFMGKHFPIS